MSIGAVATLGLLHGPFGWNELSEVGMNALDWNLLVLAIIAVIGAGVTC